MNLDDKKCKSMLTKTRVARFLTLHSLLEFNVCLAISFCLNFTGKLLFGAPTIVNVSELGHTRDQITIRINIEN